MRCKRGVLCSTVVMRCNTYVTWSYTTRALANSSFFDARSSISHFLTGCPVV